MRLSRTAALAVLGLVTPLALTGPAHAGTPTPTDPVVQTGTYQAYNSYNFSTSSCTASNPQSVTKDGPQVLSDGATYKVKKSSTNTVTSNSDSNDVTQLTAQTSGALKMTRKAGVLDKVVFNGASKATSQKALGNSSACNAESMAQTYFQGLVKIAKSGRLDMTLVNTGQATSAIEIIHQSNGTQVFDIEGGTSTTSQRSVKLKRGKYLFVVATLATSNKQVIFARGAQSGTTKISMDFTPR